MFISFFNPLEIVVDCEIHNFNENPVYKMYNVEWNIYFQMFILFVDAIYYIFYVFSFIYPGFNIVITQLCIYTILQIPSPSILPSS